ncbi:MAG: hypothetical protein A2176_03890 [Spirochaetes bacterium RBG_13_51_14]|nr:MAG: hypothetical protein A2176_03890 [Spirochaetes bacterium RBG_13_51_14]
MFVKKIIIMFTLLTLFLIINCTKNRENASLPIPDSFSKSGGDDGSSSDSNNDSRYYTEPIGDDSCSGCPGQMTESELTNLKDELEKNNIYDAKIDVNVKVTIPQSENPHSNGDVDLWATVIRPAGSEKLPTILMASPYRRETMIALYLPLVLSRYNLMAIDIRGSGSSGGEWASFDLVEQYDIKYVVDTFIPSRVWSDGNVGMISASYLGIIQMFTAGLVDTDPKTGEPVHLKALFPQMPMADAYRDIVMHGGNPDLLFIPIWLLGVDLMAILPPMLNFGVDGKVTQEIQDQAEALWLEHWNQIPMHIGWIMDVNNLKDGEFYDKKSTMIYWPVKPKGGWGFPEGKRTIPSKLPVFCVGGWFDIFTRGTTNIYQYGLSKHSNSDKRMIIGEWYHISAAMGMGLNSIIGNQLPARWFDWKIKKKPDPFMDEFPVMLYVMGEKKWRAEKSWPLPESRVNHETLYLTKRAPTPIPGDWYTDEPSTQLIKQYTNNNYSLSDSPDYSGDNPVLRHNPLNMHGWSSRSCARWSIGAQAIYSDISKFYLNNDIDAEQWYEDERQDEKECLTFTTEPLAEDMEIVGPLALTFWAKTKFADQCTQDYIDLIFDQIKEILNITDNLILDGMNKKDVQWVVELNDVFPDGRARNITSGWLSAWHRQYDPSGNTNEYYEGPWYNRRKVVENPIDPAYKPFDPFYDGPDTEPKEINEEELYQYTVELLSTCNVFKKGHRIRVSLSASDFPHLLPVVQPSDNTIVIDERHSAQIEFTAANTDDEGDTWEWIGSNADADKYLMSGGPSGCGTPASATSSQSAGVRMAAEIMGLLAIMFIPMSLIMIQRHIRRRKRA